jgi:hypothetical protein
LAIAPAPKPAKAKSSGVDLEPWRLAYNELKPDKWAKCQVLNPNRQKMIQAALAGHPSPAEALESFRRALAHVKTCKDPYWRSWDNGSIETLFHRQRWVNWAEAGEQAQVAPDAVAASGLSDQQIQAARRAYDEQSDPVLAAFRRQREQEEARRLQNEAMIAAAKAQPWGKLS